MIFAIMIGAMLFGFILTALQAPQALMALVTDAQVSRWLIFIGINIVLLALGCVLETVSIILITLPMLYPIVKSLGFDLIWFNVVMLINMELALITPPVGMNLFVIKGISEDSSIQDIIARAPCRSPSSWHSRLSSCASHQISPLGCQPSCSE